MKEKTCRELFDEFCNKYTIDQVADSKQLSMIYTYLRDRCKFANGNYIHVPPFSMREMIFNHLGYQYQLIGQKKKALS